MMQTVSPGTRMSALAGFRQHQQGALGGIHSHVDAGQFGDPVAPDAAGIHDDRGVKIFGHPCRQVAGADADHGVTVADEARDFGMEADLSAVKLGVQHIGRAQAERVDTAVRHPDGADQVGIDRRFEPPGQVGIDDFGIDAGLAAGFHEGFLVGQVVFREGDEEAVGLVDAVGCDAAEDAVLADALFGRFGIVHGIARTGVQEAVVPARGAGGDVGPLDEQGPQPAHRAVALRPRAGDAAADDDDVVFVFIHLYTFI